MRVHLCVVGRLRKGPEKDLIDDYLNRFEKSGRAFGLGPVSVLEVEDKKGGGMASEADLLRRAIPKGALIAILDERGLATYVGARDDSRTAVSQRIHFGGRPVSSSLSIDI